MSNDSSHWQFYLTSEQAWDAMYEACVAAKSSIDFEQFIFHGDAIGTRFTDLFIKKAAEGVRVRLLCDTAGSYLFYLSYLPDSLRSAGVEVVFFNEIIPWRLKQLNVWFARDHRKVLIVDRHTALVGGVGISDTLKGWRDTQLKIEGPIVNELQAAFDHMWWIGGRGRFRRFKDPRQNEDNFTLLTNAPHRRQRFVNRALLDVIRSAKREVCITTPYFVPDARFYRVLRLAARRGIVVRLLLPEKSDHPLVNYASNFYYSGLFKAGCRIFHYKHVPSGDMVENSDKSPAGAVMLHAKTMVVDDDWASVGSANIDNLSSFFNYEILISSHDKRFAGELKQQFFTDLAYARELTSAKWRRRSLWQRMFEFICIPLASFF